MASFHSSCPLDGKRVSQKGELPQGIISGIENEIEHLHCLSALNRFKEGAFFMGLYFIGAVIVTFVPHFVWAQWISIFMMGVALNSLGIFIHEGLHGLLAGNRWINHSLSFLCGLPVLISAKAYQVTHTNHHFELGRTLDYGTYKQHLKNKNFVWLAYWAQLLFGALIYIVFIPLLALKSGSKGDRLMIMMEYFAMAFLFSLLIQYLALETLLRFWAYPSIIVLILSNVRGLASHALGDVDDFYISSRTVKSSSLTTVLFMHENYHLEHHLFPQVPSYNLKKLHILIWDRLPKALYSKSYFSFLTDFFKSALTLNIEPVGLVYPSKQRQDDQL